VGSRRPRPISDSRFTIVANGFADGPAQALLNFLLAREAARVQTIFHPLVEGDTRHIVTTFERGAVRGTRQVALPVRLPFTYPLDLLVPLWPESSDGWFGFNSLACARGIAARAMNRAQRVVYWCVDFVPDRFGRGFITRAYDGLDRFCCRRADARFELSEAARQGRERRHRFSEGELAPVRVVPMGAWLDRVPTTTPDAVARRTLVFMGHLRPGQGTGMLITALALLRQRGVDVRAEIVGGGPLEDELRRAANDEGLGDALVFHGFLTDHRDVERVLASASVAVAPYEPDPSSFTRFADPGKLKAYLAAGLPILLTDVPPNAAELAAHGGAEIVPYDARALARAAERLLEDPVEWQQRRERALSVARAYDWNAILDPAMASIGFVS
jgi:glycosyltransferase involved in cell wall biosynthesis